jgi:hypothetical protein
MMYRCPTQKKRAKFLARLENLGVYHAIRSLQLEKDPAVNEQLKNL